MRPATETTADVRAALERINARPATITELLMGLEREQDKADREAAEAAARKAREDAALVQAETARQADKNDPMDLILVDELTASAWGVDIHAPDLTPAVWTQQRDTTGRPWPWRSAGTYFDWLDRHSGRRNLNAIKMWRQIQSARLAPQRRW